VIRQHAAALSSGLTSIKERRSAARRNAPLGIQGECTMPTDTMIIVAGIVIVFAIFAMVLAWVNHRTTR
jgi:hypothetical protein